MTQVIIFTGEGVISGAQKGYMEFIKDNQRIRIISVNILEYGYIMVTFKGNIDE